MPAIIIGSSERVTTTDSDVLAVGGEGTIVRLPDGKRAGKLYHDPTPARMRKVSALMAHGFTFPDEIIAPIDPIYSIHGQMIGFSMRLLPSGMHPFESLMAKNQRNAIGATTRDVMDLMISLHTVLSGLHPQGIVVGKRLQSLGLHPQKIIVGDLNPLNELYSLRRGTTHLAVVDVPSFQFDNFPCEVAMDRTLSPRLYGVDLSIRPSFTTDDDWYAFQVLLFNSLLLVHPYGGVNRKYPSLTKRAMHRITVLDPGVMYPAIDAAYPSTVLSRSLMELFIGTFAKGSSGCPDIQTLFEYKESLKDCSNCGFVYPAESTTCPQCDARNVQAVTKKQAVGVTGVEIFATSGAIVFFKAYGSKLFAVAHEKGQAVLYIRESNGAVRTLPLFAAKRGARYDVFGKYLVVNEDPYVVDSPLYIFDISGDKIVPITTSSAERYGNMGAMFRGSATNLYRIVGGLMQRGEVRHTNIVESVAYTGIENQTWFDTSTDEGHEFVAGFLRMFRDYRWFFLIDGSQYFLDIPQLDRDETMKDWAIRFSSSSMLFLRKTVKRGRESVHIDLIDYATRRITVSRTESLDDRPELTNIHGIGYAVGRMAIPTNGGLMMENVETGNKAVFDQTTAYVDAASSLWPWTNGSVLITTSQSVTAITLH